MACLDGKALPSARALVISTKDWSMASGAAASPKGLAPGISRSWADFGFLGITEGFSFFGSYMFLCIFFCGGIAS